LPKFIADCNKKICSQALSYQNLLTGSKLIIRNDELWQS